MHNRTKTAVATLVIGLALNIILGVAKLTIGILTDYASATSDALNNISDAAVSLVTIIATALAARGADKKHPFGHGRYEYIATLVVGAGVLAVGVEVFTGGLERAITPVDAQLGIAVFATLGASVAVKAFMAAFYFVRGRKTDSETIKAACFDSVSDVAVTSVVVCCALIQRYTSVNIDGYVSMAVAIVILLCALGIIRSTVSRLLGERPDRGQIDSVREIISSFPEVLSVHDIIINDYGVANKIAEADAVFPADMSFVDVHAVCDSIEHAVFDKTGIRLCVHADPLVSDERHTNVQALLDEILSGYGVTAHDLIINDEQRTVEVDIEMSDCGGIESEIKEQVTARIKTVLPYDVMINVDY